MAGIRTGGEGRGDGVEGMGVGSGLGASEVMVVGGLLSGTGVWSGSVL